MIPKTPEDLNSYIRDGGDSDRISIQQNPVPVKPTQGSGNGGEMEGLHYLRRYYGSCTHIEYGKDDP